MKSLFERMGGTCRIEGDYLLPNLIPPDTGNHPIGKYGHMHLNYLKENHGTLYTSLALNGTLWEHLPETDQSCNERQAIIIPAMAKREGVTDALKAIGQMEWVRWMNSIHNRTEEIILTELVYA